MTGMHENSDSSSTPPAKSGDCGCGCNGDRNEAKQPVSRARRSLMLGAGASTVFVLSTLANRRAFAQTKQCGPVSHAMSLHPSGKANETCGGLTPGFWMNHIGCAGKALGFSEPTSNPNYSKDLNNFLLNTTLGSQLPSLSTINPMIGGETFGYAFCHQGSDEWHWAAAILDALSPQWNPDYGYTISELNKAILTASNAGASYAAIFIAVKGLEDDQVPAPGNQACPNMKMTGC